MKQSEVWLVNFNPTVGAEIQKIRPCIIVNDDAIGILPLRIVIPVTDWKQLYNETPWMVRLHPNTSNGLQKISGADCFQVRSLSESRFIRKLGKLSSIEMREIKIALTNVFSLTEL